MFSYSYKDLDISHKLDAVTAPQSDYFKHSHDFYEIYYFVRGNAVYTVEEEKRTLSHGEILFIQPGDHHFVTLIDKSPYERYVLKFHDLLMPEFLKRAFANRSAFYSFDETFRPIFYRLDTLYETYNTEELQLLFSGIITELLIKLRHCEHQEKAISNSDGITAIIQYINENISLPLSVNDICKQFFFSPSYLYKVFLTHMKVPVKKYIRTKKIIAAYQQIKLGKKATQVAESFGFSDYSTFYRSFLSVMGFPPSQ